MHRYYPICWDMYEQRLDNVAAFLKIKSDKERHRETVEQDIAVYSIDSNRFRFPKKDISLWMEEINEIMKQYPQCSVLSAAGIVFNRADSAEHVSEAAILQDGKEIRESFHELVRLQLIKKKGQDLEPLAGRFREILKFQEDEVTASVLASSYYGIEELKMRLPRLEEILVNPFGRGQEIKALSGLIMLADGGPAEGAKAIQMYLYLNKQGINVKDLRVNRMIALFCVLSEQAVDYVKRIMKDAVCWQEEARNKKLVRMPDITECFLIAGVHDILRTASDREDRLRLNDMAFHLLSGMMDEVLTILDAIYIA